MNTVIASTARTVGSCQAARAPAARLAITDAGAGPGTPPTCGPRPIVTTSPTAYSAATAAKQAAGPSRARPTPATMGPAIFASCIDTVSRDTAVATRPVPTNEKSAVRRAGKSSAHNAPKSTSSVTSGQYAPRPEAKT